jgi:hypothetical protein
LHNEPQLHLVAQSVGRADNYRAAIVSCTFEITTQTLVSKIKASLLARASIGDVPHSLNVAIAHSKIAVDPSINFIQNPSIRSSNSNDFSGSSQYNKICRYTIN